MTLFEARAMHVLQKASRGASKRTTISAHTVSNGRKGVMYGLYSNYLLEGIPP